MTNVYVAEFRYGKANLTKAPLLKETKKTYIIDDCKSVTLFGYQYVTRKTKKRDSVFTNVHDALTYLVQCAIKAQEEAQEEARDIGISIVLLNDLVATMKDEP